MVGGMRHCLPAHREDSRGGETHGFEGDENVWRMDGQPIPSIFGWYIYIYIYIFTYFICQETIHVGKCTIHEGKQIL